MPSTLSPNADGIVCPACGGLNPLEAIFCGNTQCRKALGELDFADEIVRSESGRAVQIAERITAFAGQPHFVTSHILWFAVWIFLNSGIIASAVFDVYPFSLLGILLAIEAILLSSFVLISTNRQNAFANKRAQLDYEVNVKTYRLLNRLARSIEELERRGR